MACKACQQPRLLNKLGRCRECLIKSALFTLLSVLGWLASLRLDAEPVMQLTCLAGSVLFGGLLVLHLIYGWRFQRLGKS